jgi:Fe-S cluster assembly scaffold protein SufB
MSKASRLAFESVESKLAGAEQTEIRLERGEARRCALDLGGKSRAVSVYVADGASLSICSLRGQSSERSTLRLRVVVGADSTFEYIQAFELPSGHAHAEIVEVDFSGRNSSARLVSHVAQSSGSLWIQESQATIEQRGAGARFKQAAKSLRLGERAHAIVEPMLRVVIDEASASHGAAHGSPSPELLHAMQARGFSLGEAYEFAKDAFFSQALEGTPWDGASLAALKPESEAWI